MDTLSQGIFLAVIFLLPIFFVPVASVTFQSAKMMLLVAGVLLAFIFWIVGRLKDGVYVIPKSYMFLAVAILPVVSLISALFSNNVRSALIGEGFEVGTFGFSVITALLLFLVFSTINSQKRVLNCYIAFASSFILVGLYQLLRLFFGPQFLSFGIFTQTTSNLIGSFNELGIFFGLTTFLSLITLDLWAVSKKAKILSHLVMVLSLIFVIVSGYTMVWISLAVLCAVFFVYTLSFAKKKLSYHSIALCVIALALIFLGKPLSNWVNNTFNINQLEVRPSLASTTDILKNTLKTQPILGAGPNHFVNQWLKFRPAEVNNSLFWNTDFNYGIGLIPTFFVTLGLLGAIVWLAFLVLFLILGYKAIVRPISDPTTRYLTVVSFMGALYLWVTACVYVPTITLYALAFVFTGLFLRMAIVEKTVALKDISFSKEPKIEFVSVLALVVLLVFALGLGYTYAEKASAASDYQKSIAQFNTNNDLEAASKSITEAAQISPSDLYYRTLVQIDIAKMNGIVNRKDLSTDALRTMFQGVLGDAIQNAKTAISTDSSNYQNWLSLGSVYEAVLPLGINGAYESAHDAYTKALALNSRSPAVFLSLARLDAIARKFDSAKQYLAQALQLRNSYTEAIFLLSQIQVEEGNLKDAITSTQAAAYTSANDPGIFFQLGVLEYNNKDFKAAVSALARAVELNNSYSNARYFLGLSEAELGNYPDAIVQFTEIQKLNPDNAEVAFILQNLKAGRPPFTNAKPPVDNKPEKRKKLPV